MPKYADPIITLPALAATAAYLRVKDDGSGNVTPAGATDRDLGTTEAQALAAGDAVAVALASIDKPVKMTAAGAITKYADVYAAASGKIDDTPGTVFVGIALEAAAADGDIITVLRRDSRSFPGVQCANIAGLTDSSTGTSGGATIGAVSDVATAANGIATLAAKLNALLAALKTAKIVTAD
jgi:hypothetical protein